MQQMQSSATMWDVKIRHFGLIMKKDFINLKDLFKRKKKTKKTSK